jgi:hypothetical protein
VINAAIDLPEISILLRMFKIELDTAPVSELRRMTAETFPNEITQMLGQWRGGDGQVLDELIPVVDEKLRRMAHRHMARERPDLP